MDQAGATTGVTLKELRESRKFTQVEVAKRLGITRRLYQRWELGERDIPTGRLIPLARLYKVSVKNLLRCWAEMYSVDATEASS